MRILLYSKINI